MQVIAVRLADDEGNVLTEQYTLPAKGTWNKTDHTPMHRNAVELALNEWSGGAAILKDIQRERDGEWVKAGANSSYRWGYDCTLDGGSLEDKTDRHLWAVLFTEHTEAGKKI